MTGFIIQLGELTRPIIFTFRFSNSSLSLANAPSSVVQTGVKSAGCEKRMAQLSPTNWWKSMLPWVVCALKLGAAAGQYDFQFNPRVYKTIPVAPRRRRGCSWGTLETKRRRRGWARGSCVEIPGRTMARGRGVAARGTVRRARKTVWGRMDAIFRTNWSRRKVEVVVSWGVVGRSKGRGDGVIGGKRR